MKLALGTVQFGIDYGISNAGGQVPPDLASDILDTAHASGIALVDTAAAYGTAETVLAQLGTRQRGFSIVSKTARLEKGLAAVMARARQSVTTLGQPLDAMLVHAASDLALPEGPALWKALQELKSEGLCRRIGISAYATDPILSLAQAFSPDLMQLPVSIVDQRLVHNGTLAQLSKWGVEVHARSLFHQGLIFLETTSLPTKLMPSRNHFNVLLKTMAATGHTPMQLAMAYAHSIDAIRVAVVGVTTPRELEEIVKATRMPVPQTSFSHFATTDPLLLDPTRW